jgi:hypothetical protein
VIDKVGGIRKIKEEDRIIEDALTIIKDERSHM